MARRGFSVCNKLWGEIAERVEEQKKENPILQYKFSSSDLIKESITNWLYEREKRAEFFKKYDHLYQKKMFPRVYFSKDEMQQQVVAQAEIENISISEIVRQCVIVELKNEK